MGKFLCLKRTSLSQKCPCKSSIIPPVVIPPVVIVPQFFVYNNSTDHDVILTFRNLDLSEIEVHPVPAGTTYAIAKEHFPDVLEVRVDNDTGAQKTLIFKLDSNPGYYVQVNDGAFGRIYLNRSDLDLNVNHNLNIDFVATNIWFENQTDVVMGLDHLNSDQNAVPLVWYHIGDYAKGEVRTYPYVINPYLVRMRFPGMQTVKCFEKHLAITKIYTCDADGYFIMNFSDKPDFDRYSSPYLTFSAV